MPTASRATPTNHADAQLRSALTSHVDAMLGRFMDGKASTHANDPRKGPKHPYIVFVNREAEKLLRMFRASVKEQVRALPGRAQKGAVDAAMRAVAPKVKKAAR